MTTSAVRIAELALAAYEPLEEFRAWAIAAGGSSPYWATLNGDVVVGVVFKGKRYVGIRGTDGLGDWFSNIHRDQIHGVHAGFWQSFKGIRKIIPHDARAGAVWCGHSRGGALATIAAREYGGHLFTYGSPRVFDVDRCRAFGRKVSAWRYTVRGDPVPWLPLFGYYHVGNRVKLTRSNDGAPRHSMLTYLHEVRRLS